MEEIKDLLTRGAYFNYKKIGHRSRECLKNLIKKRASNAYIVAIIAKMGYDKKTTNDSSTTKTGFITSTNKVLKILSEAEGN